MLASEWTSLEIVRLIVDVLMPVAVVVLGIVVARSTSRLEDNQWANRKLIESRLDIYRDVAPGLNKLYCFFSFVGGWKEVTPADVISIKREVDEQMYVNRILFSDGVFDAYGDLMTTMFGMYEAKDRDAPIRAHIATDLGDRRSRDWWDEELLGCFATDELPSLDEVGRVYLGLSNRFRDDLYVTDRTPRN